MDKVFNIVIIVIITIIIAISALLIIININHYNQLNMAVPVDIRGNQSFQRYEANLIAAEELEHLMQDDICAITFANDSFRDDINNNYITIRNLNRWSIDEQIIWHECINLIFYNIRILDPNTDNAALRRLSNQYIELGSYYHTAVVLNEVFEYTYVPDLEPTFNNNIRMRETMSYFYLNFLKWLEANQEEGV